jgi:hypothetical protein
MPLSHVDMSLAHVDMSLAHVDMSLAHVDMSLAHVDMSLPHSDMSLSHPDMSARAKPVRRPPEPRSRLAADRHEHQRIDEQPPRRCYTSLADAHPAVSPSEPSGRLPWQSVSHELPYARLRHHLDA